MRLQIFSGSVWVRTLDHWLGNFGKDEKYVEFRCTSKDNKVYNMKVWLDSDKVEARLQEIKDKGSINPEYWTCEGLDDTPDYFKHSGIAGSPD